jgi:hypothetical protein
VPFLPHVRADHDETLVARLAANDLAPRELEAARAQVADCPACAELLADLRSIASATAQLPAPRRTRDFRLTEADSARLRPAGWRGLLARLGSPGFAFAKPLAGGLAALGVAGLILASLPSGLGGSAAGPSLSTIGNPVAGGAETSRLAAPAVGPEVSGEGPLTASSNPIAAPAASAGVGVTMDGGYSVKDGSSGPEVAAAPSATAQGAAGDLSVGRDRPATAEPPSALLVLSMVLLAAAVVLGGLRLMGRWLA